MRETSPRPVFVPMDPRIRRRRLEVRRTEGRRRLRILLAFAGAILLSAACWLGLRSPLVDVDRIDVEGANQVTVDEVRQAAGVEHGTALIDVDADAAATRIEALPWVDRARVRRHWPGTVTITVTERAPAATARVSDERWAVLDFTGRVLAWAPSAPAGVVTIEGLASVTEPGGTVEEARAPLAVVEALSPALAARTAAVVVVDGGLLELRLNPHGTVRLGLPDDIAAKVRAAETVLASVDDRGLAVLDVRLPSSPVVTRSP